MTSTHSNIPVWSVSGLSFAIKEKLKETFSPLMVEGEISNCRPSGAGHVYFTLKDRDAVISAVLFRGQSASLRIQPSDGMKVIVSGTIDLYPPRGMYQLIVKELKKSGRGDILEAIEERKQRLALEGLFKQERKRPLPPYPRHIAVVTSPTGAAIRDILQVLARRTAAPLVTILPTLVQGNEAAQMIADQITRADKYHLGDVIILARGGGSGEDLMPFNEEVLVRSIAVCELPVICGVGHEVDVSLADLAADVRAATPSAAAELVSDRSEDLLLRARGFRKEAQDILQTRISDSHRRLLHCGREELINLARNRMEFTMRKSDDAHQILCKGAQEWIGDLRQRFELARQSLSDSSPKSLLNRGYARIMHDGKGVCSAEELVEGEHVTIHFSKDMAMAKVLSIQHNGEQKQ